MTELLRKSIDRWYSITSGERLESHRYWNIETDFFYDTEKIWQNSIYSRIFCSRIVYGIPTYGKFRIPSSYIQKTVCFLKLKISLFIFILYIVYIDNGILLYTKYK